MNGFINEFMKNMGPEVSREMTSNLGIKKNTAMKIIPQVAPLILGGLQRQKTDYGDDRVDHILNKYGNASVLDNISGLFAQKAHDPDADPQLGGLLGNAGLQAANMLQSKFNLDKETAMKIIPMLAPVMLGFLTKKRDSDGVGINGVASLLDQDGDGSVLDDVAGMFLKNLGGTGSKSHALGGLIGGLLGKRR